MDTYRLQHFIALAEELNFHRAAERCHVSQPTMSQQLKLLEGELGVQLIRRTKRVVALTPAGQVFLDEARRLVRQVSQSVSRTRRVERGELGQLHVGATGSALYVAIPEILRGFRQVLPGIGVMVRQLSTAEQERALRDGSIDVGIVHPPLDDPNLNCEVIARVPFTIVLPARHELAEKGNLKLADLAHEQFILFSRSIAPRLYDGILSLCQDAGFSPVAVLETHPAQSIIALAAAELGIGFIATNLQQHPRAGVVYRPLVEPRPYYSLGVASIGDTESRSVGVFREAAKRSVAHLERAFGTPDSESS